MSAHRPPRPDPIPIEALRTALREAIGTRSLRGIASEIGISHTGLRGFLSGARSHPHTRLKVERWLTSDSARRVREVGDVYKGSRQGAYVLGQAAVRALAEAADPRLTTEAARQFHELITQIFRDAGKELPDWLESPE